MFGGTNDNIDEIKKLDHKEVAGIKLFLGSSTGKMLIDNQDSIENIFNNTSLPISAHCEDEQTIKDNTEYFKNLYGDDTLYQLIQRLGATRHAYKVRALLLNLQKKQAQD